MADLSNWNRKQSISLKEMERFLLNMYIERAAKQSNITIWTWNLEPFQKALLGTAESYLKANYNHDN